MSKRRANHVTLRKIKPGEVVVAEFSCGEAARACGVSRSTVMRWARERPSGTGGMVPARYHIALLGLSAELGRQLTAEDLVYGRHKHRAG